MTIVMENISLSVWAVLHDVFESKWPVTIIAQNDPTPIMYICTIIYTKKGKNEIFPTSLRGLASQLTSDRNVQNRTRLLLNFYSKSGRCSLRRNWSTRNGPTQGRLNVRHQQTTKHIDLVLLTC